MKIELGTKDETKKERKLLSPGVYDFEILSAEECESAKGNQMMKLVLGIDCGSQYPHKVYDYLVMNHKAQLCKDHIKNFLEANKIGVPEGGELTAGQCENIKGRCELMIELSEQYGDKNKVKCYVPKTNPQDKAPTKAFFDDDQEIPF